MSLSCVFSIDFSCDEFNIIVEAEDAGDEQEGLGDIDQQSVRHVVNHDDLISHQRNAAHDEQHRTGVLRDFKARVFHNVLHLMSDVFHLPSSILHHHGFACCTKKGSDNVTCNLKDCLPCFVHNSVCLKC